MTDRPAEEHTELITPRGDRIVFPSRYEPRVLQLLSDFATRFHIPLKDITKEHLDACLAAVMETE